MNNNFSEEILTRSLKTSPEIKILICHILNKFNISLNRQEIVSILQEGDIANYFEINSAIKQLVDDKNIKNLGNNSNIYKITSTGKIIAEQLIDNLPKTVKEKAEKTTLLHLKNIKSRNENKVDIIKNNNGYNVLCVISGGTFDLMSVNIYVPTLERAMEVKKNFYKNPINLYSTVLKALTNDSK